VALAVVLVVVVVVVVVAVTGSTNAKSRTASGATKTLIHEVTHIKSSVYDAVGTGATAGVTALTQKTGKPALTYTTKPGLLYVGGEFCPFCAAERWGIIASLSRFGKFTGLQLISSAAKDTDPTTPTFSFNKATYTSTYLVAQLVEYYGQDNATGVHGILNKLTPAQQKTVNLFTTKATTASSTGGVSIPFIDVGNKYVQQGASYQPSLLAGLTQKTIAAGLSTASSPITKAIVGTSNYFSAAICNVDGTKPADVCSSSGVQAANKAIKKSTS
jgi:hypothetical protein